MRSRFDSSRFDSSLVGLQWALRFVLLLMVLMALAACSDDPTDSGRAIVAVQVTAAGSQVEPGDSLILTARPRQADGRTRTDLPVSWLSTDTSIAKVEGRAGQKAVVIGKAPGPVTIRAMAGEKVGQTSLIVVVAEAGVPIVNAISPASANEGQTLVEITVAGANFTELSLVLFNGVAIPTQFVSSTELKGLIAATNLAQAGTAEVAVRTGPPGGGTSAGKPFTILSRVVTVRVTSPAPTLWVGEEVELEAIPQDGQGQDLPKRATAWASEDPNLFSIDANGRVKARAAGLAVITATVDGRTGSTYVHAVDAPVYDLMFDSNRAGGGRELWIVSLGADATPRRWLPEGFLGEDAATNSNGTRIAFVGRDQYLNTDIWVANRDGSGLTRLTTDAHSDDQPAWSPDGSKIVFRSTRGVQSQIWIMDADGSNQRNLMGDSYNVLDGQQSRPSFGANGRIYFQITYPDSTSSLASMPANGTWQEVTLHTPAGYSDYEPAVSWDGSRLMVRRKLRNSSSAGVIVYTDLNGNQLFTLAEPGIGWTPGWSRNDQYITFSSSPDGLHPTDIYVRKRNEFWTKRITTGVAAGGGRNPVFIKR